MALVEQRQPAENSENAAARLRVLFLTNTFAPEPGALRGLPFAKWLKRRGADPLVLTAFPSYPLGRIYDGYKQSPAQWTEMDGIPVLRTWVYPSHDTSALKRIVTYLSFTLSAILFGLPKVGRPDVVFFVDNTPATGLVALLLKKLRGVPYNWHIGDLWPDSVTESAMIRNKSLRRTAEKLIGAWCHVLYRNAATVSVLSHGFKEILVSRGVPAEKIEVIFNWADEDAFSPMVAPESLRRELGFGEKISFVYAGNFGPLQDLETVVRAAALLKDDPQLEVVLIGTGPHEASIKALAQDLGLQNLRFIGRRPVEEMNALNAASDVMIVHLRDIPLMRSTIPSKVQVTLACGRPIILAVHGDAACLIKESGAGLLAEPGDPESLAKAMREFAQMSREERESMGAKGRAYYESCLSLEVGGRATEKVLLRAARPTARTAR